MFSKKGLKYISVLCFHDFLLGLFAASLRDLLVHAASIINFWRRERLEGHGMEETESLSWGKEEDHERELGLSPHTDGSNSEEREKQRGDTDVEEEEEREEVAIARMTVPN